jgi:DNA-binding XRE family transcriptional regulator
MLTRIRELTDDLRRYDKDLRQAKNKQVFSGALKQRAKAVVDRYFREAREQLLIGGITELTSIDDAMHRLLEISQRNSAVATYRGNIKRLQTGLAEIEKQVLLSQRSPKLALDSVDKLIMEALAGLLPSAARSYEQAILDLQTNNRLSWRGPATDLRESLRETLDYLAPDADVTNQTGFKLEKDRSGPTMKQKVRHILKKRGLAKTAIEAPESATDAVDELVGQFIRGVYSRSSVSTHTPTDKGEILRIRDWVRAALAELLQLQVGT